MNKNKKKILFLINTKTSYQNNFYSELSKKIDIKVIVLNKKFKNYNFKIKENFYSYIENKNQKKNKIKKIINNFNPTHIVFGGYRLRYTNYIKNYALNQKIKIYYWLERLNKKNNFKILILKILFKKILKNIDGIFAVGEEAKKFYKNFNKNVINLPYSIKFNEKNKKRKINEKKINFIFVGQLIKRKGFDVVLSLLNNANLSNANFNIVGEGKYKKDLLKITKKFKNIKYYPFQNTKKLNALYSESDVLIFLSRFDGWGVVALEAMNHNLAIISSKYVGVKEVYPRQKIIIDPKYSDLHQKINLLSNNFNLVKKLGLKNKASLKKSLCNSKHAVKKFIDFI